MRGLRQGGQLISAGIDMGSRAIKVVILKDGEVVARASSTGGFEQREAARWLFEKALSEAGVGREAVCHITATGMGRETVDFADSRVTDVTAAAKGAAHYFPGAATIVEVGAEESRAVKSDGKGRPLDSAVNDKCAAGSGSFTESMARALGMDLAEFGEKSVEATESVSMNAQCTVFAESEVVSLIHRNVDKREIARAVHDAIAVRVASLVRRIKLEGEVVLFGGMAYNPGFRKSLMEKLEVERLLIPEKPEFADAVGAALVAASRAGAVAKGAQG